MSKVAFATITPVTPPNVNMQMNPKANHIASENRRKPPHKVAIQLNIFMPVGIAITIVAAVKYARVSTSKPTVNIW